MAVISIRSRSPLSVRRRKPSLSFLVRPIASSSALALSTSWVDQVVRHSGPGIVGRALRRHDRARRADAEPEGLVELVAVEPQRQGAAEVGVGQPLRDLGIGVVALVDLQHRVRAVVGQVEMDGVAALLLVLEDHRQLGDVDVPLLQVVLAGDGAQVQDLEVLGQRELHPVDVGQLVALGVDRPVEGVALEHPGRRVDRLDRLPGAERRQLGIERPVLLEVQELHPVLVAGLLRLGVGLVDASCIFGRNCDR